MEYIRDITGDLVLLDTPRSLFSFWEPINRAYLNFLLEMLPHRTSHVRSMQWRGPPEWP